jgi:hypothetical protein
VKAVSGDREEVGGTSIRVLDRVTARRWGFVGGTDEDHSPIILHCYQ